MEIKELTICKSSSTGLDIAWELSEGEQSSYDLFLIKGGSVIERAKNTGAGMKCSLNTAVEPMKEYALLLTVRSGRLLSTARAGFCTGSDAALYQCITYQPTC